MGQPAPRIGRDVQAAGVVEGRIHQHVIGTAGAEPGGGQRLNVFRIGDDRPHPAIKTVQRGIAGRQRRQRRIDLNQRDRHAVDTPGQRQPGAADAGAEIDRMIACSGVHRRRQQHGIVSNAVPAQRLTQAQAAAEDGVFAGAVNVSRHRGEVRGQAGRLPAHAALH